MSYMDTKSDARTIQKEIAIKTRSVMVTLFTKYLELPTSYFDRIVIRDGSDCEPFEAYSRSDLKSTAAISKVAV